MKSPFPGMDPFIEAQWLWGDFHDSLVVAIKREIQRQLPPRYIARVADRTFVEQDDPDLELLVRTKFGPDVEIQRKADVAGAVQGASDAAAVADPPVAVINAQVEFEERQTFLDIYKLDPTKQLVTSIEVLSPSNKRRGSVGWDQYERKRNVFVHGYANLVEIDLLRGGNRHPMDQPWPDSPCAIAVIRKERAPSADIWSAFTLRPLPTIPIPLLPPDADVVIALQPLVSEIYESSRYATDIQYDQPIRPPLNSEEQLVVAEHLRPK